MNFGLLFRPQDPPNAEHIGRRWQDLNARRPERPASTACSCPSTSMMPDGYLPAPLVACGALAARTNGWTSAPPCSCSPTTTRSRSPSRRPWSTSSGGGCGWAAAWARCRRNSPSTASTASRDLALRGAIPWSARPGPGPSWTHGTRAPHRPGRSARCRGAELWLGAVDGGVRRAAARFGVPWINEPLHNISVMSEWASRYRQAGEVRHVGTQQVVLSRDRWGPTAGRRPSGLVALHPGRATGSTSSRSPAGWLGRRAAPAPGSRRNPTSASRPTASTGLSSAAGNCIAAISELRDALPMDYLIMSFRMAAGPAHEQELE